MKILLVHQNFPAQFRHLAPALAAAGHDLTVMTMQPPPSSSPGIRWVQYGVARGSTAGIHPWITDIESKVIRGEACLQAALGLLKQGLTPDLILAHPGWGESSFLKQAWPSAKLAIYCEFYYRATGADSGFDPEFPRDLSVDASRLQIKNVNSLLHFELADSAISPTAWQASTYPADFQKKIRVIHDGIDTQKLTPKHDVSLQIRTATGDNIRLTRRDPIVTFVNRNLEPCRGYHQFMRSLPALLSTRRDVRILIIGGDEVSYGAAAPGGQKWKDIYINEVRPRISDADWARVHFLGRIPYPHFVSLIQLSTVHVYLTYPFVLSWSLLEAMSVGCAVIGSNTAPVQEVIEHDVNGRLVDFFDSKVLVEQTINLLDDPLARRRLGSAARELVCARYDLKTVCLPKQLAWVDSLSGL